MKAGCKNDCDCFIQHDSGVFSENSDITKPETRITKRIGNPDALFPGKKISKIFRIRRFSKEQSAIRKAL